MGNVTFAMGVTDDTAASFNKISTYQVHKISEPEEFLQQETNIYANVQGEATSKSTWIHMSHRELY